MITPRFIVGFSGHRNLADESLIRPQIEQALKKLSQIAKDRHEGVLEVFTSIAYGADLLMADEAIAQKLPLHLVIPKPVENHDETKQLPNDKGFAADFWGKKMDEQGKETKVFREADWKRSLAHIVDARKGTHGGSLRLVRGAQTSPECYYDAGVQMVDVSDVIIAVWNGEVAEGLGGTGDVVELAKKRGLPLIWIHSVTGEVTEEGMEKFAAVNDKGCEVMGLLARYVRECLPKSKKVKDRGEALNFPMGIEEATQALSDTAMGMADDFRDSQKWIILGHGIATAVAAVSAAIAEYQGYHVLKYVLACLAVIEFGFVAYAYWHGRRLHHGEVHEAWMETRFASEIIRGLKDAGKLLDPLSPLIARHHPNWRRFATSAAIDMYRKDRALEDWQTQRDEYVAKRLLGTRGQVKYFTDKQEEAEKRFKKLAKWGTRFGLATFWFVLGAALYKSAKALGWTPPALFVKDVTVVLFVLFPILLPLWTGIFISLRNAMDAGRRTYRYKEMAERLKEAAEQINTLKSASSTRRAIAATEEILIDELNEWHLAEKQNEVH